MIDNDYNPWLIEVNSSPSMEYSTVILKNLNSSYLFLLKASHNETSQDVYGRYRKNN